MRFIALWLIGLCVLTFVGQQFVGTDVVILDRSLMLTQPWRLVTSIFAHGSIGHLLANMFALGLFGLILEGRIGPKRILWLFLISGVLINLITPYERSLGASGAIFAILGVLIVLRPLMIIWMNMLPVPMFIAGIAWFIQDFFGLFNPSNVGNIAHIGGLVIGLIVGAYWWKQFGDRRKKNKHNIQRHEKLDREIDAWEDKYMKH